MNLFNKIATLFKNFDFLQLLYPPHCRFCENLINEKTVFCNTCIKLIKPIATSFIHVTKKYNIKVFAISNYEEPLKSLILRKSCSDILACKQIAQLIHKKTNIKNTLIDFIVPIPLHWTRYAWRGYNQSHEMAKILSKKLKVPILNILKRNKRTVFQSQLSPEKRSENVKNVFQIHKKYQITLNRIIKNKNILLVDDLCTTGATLKNAARPIITKQPKSISAVVACRVI